MSPRDFLFVVCLASSMTFLEVVGSSNRLKTISTKEWTDAAKANGKLLVVFFKEEGCPTCEETMDVVSRLIEYPELDPDLPMGKSSDLALASDLKITMFPAVVFLRENSHAIYHGKAEAEFLLEWLEQARSKVTHVLHDDSFEHLTQASTGATTGDWLVAFYKDSCSGILPTIESVGVRIRHKTNVAIVDSSKNKLLADRFSIKNCPEIILFKQGKMYRYEIPSRLDQPSLKSFVEAWHINSKAETVLPPKSRFDFLTETIADNIKTQLQGKNRLYFMGGLAVVIGIFMLIVVLCCCCCGSGSDKQKLD